MALLKFLKGNYSSLSNAAIAEGQILVCGDTGEMFVDVAADKRVKIGDFITVANIAALEALDATAVPTSRLYYVEDGNILARSNGSSWIQVNKQKTAEELKTMLGLGSMAYVSEIAESHLSAALAEKVNAASEGNHSHANKALLDTYTQTEADLADAVAKKHEHANKTELDKIAAGDVAKWNGVLADHLVAQDKADLESAIADVATAVSNEESRAKLAEKASADAIAAIKDDANIDSFADVVAELAKKQNVGDYATKEEAQAMADGKDAAIKDAKDAADAASALAATKTTMGEVEAKGYQTAAQVQAIADGKDEAIAAAQKAGDDAQDAVDALSAKVGTVPADKTIVGMIADAQAEATYDDTALSARVKAIEDDYLKEADKYDDTAIIDRIEVIEGDYLKAADKYDDAAIVGRVKAIEDDYLKAADKEALQTQINTIMNNPDAEGAINSINEFAQYVKDHGTIADGFRTDINANAKAIEDLEGVAATHETKTDAAAKLAEAKEHADGLNTAMDTRVKVLEGINHEAYVAADATLKSELQAEIDADVKALADGQVATNAAGIAANVEAIAANGVEIAKKANSADVYLKTEAYSQAEIDAMFTWGSF